MHTLTPDEKAALRQFYLPPYPEGWMGLLVRTQDMRSGMPMRVLFRLRLVEMYGTPRIHGQHFRLTETGIQVRELMNRGEGIAVGEPPRLASEPVEIITHDYLDNIARTEEPELTELELEILRAFVPGTSNSPGLFLYVAHEDFETYEPGITPLLGQGFIAYERAHHDVGVYRLRPSGYPLRRRALGTSVTVEETPPPSPIQAGQRRLRNRNKK